MQQKFRARLRASVYRTLCVQSPRLQNQRGVTLIEIMTTVVIIGIVAAMAGPRFSHEMEKMEFRGAARNMVSMIRQARSLAIAEKTTYGVAFNNMNGTFTLFKDVVTSNPASFQDGDSALSVDTIPGEYVTIVSTFANAVSFKPNGSASESGNLTAISFGSVVGSATSYATISVLSSTGRVRMDELQSY